MAGTEANQKGASAGCGRLEQQLCRHGFVNEAMQQHWREGAPKVVQARDGAKHWTNPLPEGCKVSHSDLCNVPSNHCLVTRQGGQ